MCGAWEEGLSGSLATLFPDNAIECVVHGCDVLNKRGFALSKHTLVLTVALFMQVVLVSLTHLWTWQ